MSTFQSRAKKLSEKGELTIADLRYWFARPYPTVWRWVHSGWEPGLSGQRKSRNAGGKKAERDLDLLDKAIRLELFPVPDHITSGLRSSYVRNAYHAAERARVPEAHTA